jgi:hypothetical protein
MPQDQSSKISRRNSEIALRVSSMPWVFIMLLILAGCAPKEPAGITRLDGQTPLKPHLEQSKAECEAKGRAATAKIDTQQMPPSPLALKQIQQSTYEACMTEKGYKVM